MSVKDITVRLLIILVIAGSVLLPSFISDVQDKNDMNKPLYSKMQDLSFSDKKDLNAGEKLLLINSLGQPNKTIMMTEQDKAENTSIDKDELYEICIEQLQEMQDINIFPYIDLDEAVYDFNYVLQTYIDIKETSKYVLIWQVTISYKSYNVKLSIDDETHKIYSFIISSHNRVTDLISKGLKENWSAK